MTNIRLYGFAALLFMAMGFVACEKSAGGATQPVEDADFEFENISSDYVSFSLDILPKDKASEYIVFMSDKRYFEVNGITTQEALIEDDVIYFREYAAAANLGLREFLTKAGWLVTGDKIGYGGINLMPATEYVVYCYGVEFTGDYYTVTTDVNYTVVSTTAPRLESINFDVECTVEGNILNVAVTPEDGYDGLYYVYVADAMSPGYVIQGNELTDELLVDMRNHIFTMFRGYVVGDGKAPASFCMRGATDISHRLMPNINYMVSVFAVSDDQVPVMCSQPVIEHALTGEVQLSDLEFDIAITDITPYTAQMSIAPSRNEEYAALLISAASLDNMPEDELSLMYAMIKYFVPAIYDEPFSEMLTPLMPETEYAMIAFGCVDGHPTSHITIKRFTTEAATKGSNSIHNVVIHKVWDVNEIVALDPTYAPLAEKAECLVLVEAIVDDPTCPIYYWWYEGFARDEYSDEAFLEDSLLFGPTPSPEVMGLWYDFEFFFAGMVEDSDGNLSDIYYGDIITLSREDCSDAQEYLDMVRTGVLPIEPSMFRQR